MLFRFILLHFFLFSSKEQFNTYLIIRKQEAPRQKLNFDRRPKAVTSSNIANHKKSFLVFYIKYFILNIADENILFFILFQVGHLLDFCQHQPLVVDICIRCLVDRK